MEKMNWSTSLHPLGGIKIIVDKNCYTEKVTHRAIAVAVDVHRPNKVKPIYKVKRFVKRTPRAYMVKDLGLIVHPEIYSAIQKKMSDSVLEQERKAFASLLGVDTSPLQPKGLTLSDLQDVIKRFETGV
jgi:hypothetical protein